MTAPVKVLITAGALLALAALAAACGTQRINVASPSPLHEGAALFNQRCSGCHTLSYAAANGSASNVRSGQFNNGPNFNVRCERPVDRVLYAIANGGFSGQIMPQNIVVGQQAADVAKFVATYAGRQAPKVPGAIQCDQQPVGTITTSQSSSSGGATATTRTALTPGQGGIPGATTPAIGANKKKKK
ncbi:MAG: cytochrome c [Solirubrobacterales bacterium]|nr:cytochrome c [Solirubrobacterales bacterium]MBV9717263.1 cytochrome c [Solirubrobacterales bacterium]